MRGYGESRARILPVGLRGLVDEPYRDLYEDQSKCRRVSGAENADPALEKSDYRHDEGLLNAGLRQERKDHRLAQERQRNSCKDRTEKKSEG